MRSAVLKVFLALAFALGGLASLGAGGPNGPPEKEVVIFIHYPQGYGPPEWAKPPTGGGGSPTSCPYKTFAKWSDTSKALTFVVDTAASGIAAADAHAGVLNAFAAWDASSGLPAPSAGSFSGLPSSYTGLSNDTNEVAWASLSALGYTNAIAVTWTWRYVTTKVATEWDMVFNNDPGFAWAQNNLGSADPDTASGVAGKYDVQNIGTHEAGHAVGLDHVREASHTMYTYGSAGEVKKRSLECGDAAGAQKLYGAG